MVKRKSTDNTMVKRKRRDNTMVKRKRTKDQTMIHTTLHTKTKDGATQIHQNSGDRTHVLWKFTPIPF